MVPYHNHTITKVYSTVTNEANFNIIPMPAILYYIISPILYITMHRISSKTTKKMKKIILIVYRRLAALSILAFAHAHAHAHTHATSAFHIPSGLSF
jgi:hypothetical protein